MEGPATVRVRAAAVLLLCAVVAGCSQDVVPREETRGFPARPLDIGTHDVAPCSMLTSAQGVELGLDEGQARVANVNEQRSPACIWLSESDISYSAQTIPIGAEAARSEVGAAIIEVNGFGAVRSIPRALAGGTPICQVTVDAGPGQSIRVQAQATGERPRTEDEMCRIATDVTGMVMTTVVATARR